MSTRRFADRTYTCQIATLVCELIHLLTVLTYLINCLPLLLLGHLHSCLTLPPYLLKNIEFLLVADLCSKTFYLYFNKYLHRCYKILMDISASYVSTVYMAHVKHIILVWYTMMKHRRHIRCHIYLPVLHGILRKHWYRWRHQLLRHCRRIVHINVGNYVRRRGGSTPPPP